MTTGIEKYEQLITGLKRIADDTADARYDYFEKEFRQLKEGIDPIILEWLDECKKTAARYNIFKILEAESIEKMHSDFLANLLNPRGSHDQGSIFLDGFLSLLSDKKAVLPEKRENPIISREKHIATEDEKGRIDIHIEFAGKFAIIIENKIRSGGSWRQLQKYLKSQYNDYLLIYLTPDGRDPSEDSPGISVIGKLKSEHELVCLSYGNIARWLEGVIVKPSRLQEIVNMYLEVIRELSRTEEEDESKTISEKGI
jgi:hypothetical protein